MRVELGQIRQALPPGGLFGSGDAGWRWSPEPLRLGKAAARRLERLGHPLARFQAACGELYRRSAQGSLEGWLAELLDTGKPAWLVEVQRAHAMLGQRPRVIRPDLVWEDAGFALAELDAVPGGTGITAWLARLYAEAGFAVLGGADGMLDGFSSLLPEGGQVLVSDESADYRPELEWLVGRLNERGGGAAWRLGAAEQWSGGDEPIYRFFELFDWEKIPGARRMAEAAAAGRLEVTPPFKPHFEDKLWLALFWAPALAGVWQQALRGAHLRLLRELVPFGWVVDPQPLPPHAALPRLEVHGWPEVAALSQKQRRLVLKISGFHELAWGSRGVFIGHDLAAAEWQQRLAAALDDFDSQPWIMQEFREGRLIEHPVYEEDGRVTMMTGRARLCPYYFTDGAGNTSLRGCLATLVPADKKKIHGMRDGVLMPCVV
jgi:hypothetical protein